MIYRGLIFGFLCLFSVRTFSQQVDLENLDTKIKETIKKNPFSVSGSLSANGVYSYASDNEHQEPFLYFFQGNVNIGIYDWSIPLSYRFTNQGKNFDYQIPLKFNRLSLHPKYKWIQAHIGDVSMTFSPYTFNGLQFTGGGLELTPEKIPFRASFMGGRLQKAIEYDSEHPQTVPTYERWGYGTKIEYKKENIEFGGILFMAKDKPNSLLQPIPDEKNIYPLENQVYSFFGKYKPLHFVEVFGEYALSALGYADENPQNYSAYNAGINFILSKGSIGVRYESVAPEYRTLGAYYFVNDMENITLNSSINLWQGRVTLSSSIGKQRDNLNGQKIKQSNQWVGSVNLSAKVTEAFSLTGSYSNFTMFTNKQMNPFERINNPLLYEQPQDSIKYRQVSQNTAINASYALSEHQQLSLTYTLNDVVNRENDIVRRGGISRFHNVGINYSLFFPERKLSVTPSFNYTHNWVARKKSQILGPSVAVSKMLLEDKLNLSLGGNYSRSISTNAQANTANVQLGANYSPWKQHQFTFSAVQSFRDNHSQNSRQSAQQSNISIGYVYNFAKTEIPLPKFNRKKKEKENKEKPNKNSIKEDTTPQKEVQNNENNEVINAIELPKEENKEVKVSEKTRNKKEKVAKTPKKAEKQVRITEKQQKTAQKVEKNSLSKEDIKNTLSDLPFMTDLQAEITELETRMKDKQRSATEQRKDREAYVKALGQAEKLQKDYRFFVFRCLQNLYNQARQADGWLKDDLFAKKQLWDKEKTAETEEKFRKAEEGYTTHLWMIAQLEGLTLEDVINDKGILKVFSQRNKENIYQKLSEKIATKEKMDYISVLLADFYHKYEE